MPDGLLAGFLWRTDSWTVAISGSVQCKHPNVATLLWCQMVIELFELMTVSYKLWLEEFYGCMVDLLGRAGRVQEAYEVIGVMPMGSAVSLGKLSWVHSKVMAKWISHIRFLCMFRSWESSDSGVYVLLSNVYSVNDRWTDVKRARGLMYEEEMHKELGSNELMCIGKPVNSYSWDVGCSAHSNEAISFWGPVVLLTNNWFSLKIEMTSWSKDDTRFKWLLCYSQGLMSYSGDQD